jgi:hypothetical protein
VKGGVKLHRDIFNSFIKRGGVSRIGAKAAITLERLVTEAESKGYPESIELNPTDIKYWCDLPDNSNAYYVRKKLIEFGLIKDYEYQSKTSGIFFLNYDVNLNQLLSNKLD